MERDELGIEPRLPPDRLHRPRPSDHEQRGRRRRDRLSHGPRPLPRPPEPEEPDQPDGIDRCEKGQGGDLDLVLKEVEGLSCREIAVILKCPEATVRSHLFHARKGLQSHLREHYPELVPGEGKRPDPPRAQGDAGTGTARNPRPSP